MTRPLKIPRHRARARDCGFFDNLRSWDAEFRWQNETLLKRARWLSQGFSEAAVFAAYPLCADVRSDFAHLLAERRARLQSPDLSPSRDVVGSPTL